MKHDLRNSLLAKVIAIFLAVLFGLAALFSVGSLAISYESGFYKGDNVTFEETDMFENLSFSMALDVARAYVEYGQPYSYFSGAPVVIRDGDTGEVLFTDRPAAYRSTRTFTFLNSDGYITSVDGSPGFSVVPETDAPAELIQVTLYFEDYGSGSGYYDMESYYLFYQLVYPIKHLLPWLAVLSIVGFFAVLAFLFCAAGHRAGHEEIVPNWQDRIPLDVYLLAVGFLCTFNVLIVGDLNAGGWIQLALIVLLCLPLFLLVLAALLTIATRLKMGRFWENTLCYRLVRWLWHGGGRIWHSIGAFVHILPLSWRAVLLMAGLLILQPLLAVWGLSAGIPLVLLLLLDAAILVSAAFLSYQLQRLKAVGQELAAGNLEAKVDTKGMFWDLKAHGEHLNAIGEGMNRAVEQRMKSERLKTELITNVSHDIKTPLTSIVNYVDLLKKEELPERAAEYVTVLDRQSNRLKKLTEDLVEASKASTGNIAVHLQPIVVNEIVHQAVGDYDQKLTAGKLEVVINTYEGNLTALADGRLLWRVLDNLLSNVCKYAMAGSRVYIDLMTRGDRVALSMKNVSRDRLNISADELMERFVRGDASRHAEGSGLGLNIAKSLMELMGGTFSLAVDGDLFKAELTLKSTGAAAGTAAGILAIRDAG